MSYLKSKPGSIEELARSMSPKLEADYQDKFKKELDKTGHKGIGTMSPKEKKAFFNKMDSMHKAKNEDSMADKKNAERKAVKGEKIVKEGIEGELIDLEDDAAEMSLQDSLKKHKGGIANDATLRAVWRKVNEEFDINEKYVAKFSDGKGDVEVDAKQSAHDINKKLRKKVGDRMKYFTGYKKVNESVNEDQEKNPANFQHLCAKQVTHESWGEGETVYSMHAEPDEEGNIAWYDVMFEHGIEKQVPITELKVLTSANHNNAHKMGKGKKSLKSAHCSEFEPQGNQVNEETEIDEKKQYYMYSKKADAEKKAKEIGGKVEKSTAAHFPGYYAVKEETETKSIEQSIMDVWNSAAGEQIKREDDMKWLKTEEKKNLVEDKVKCPNCGHMNDADAKKCSNCGYNLRKHPQPFKTKGEQKDTKKKAMTGTPATKVDTEPEAEFDIK